MKEKSHLLQDESLSLLPKDKFLDFWLENYEEISKDYFIFMHFADSHNGNAGNSSKSNEFKALRIEKTTENGINIRQDDIDKTFAQVIDNCIKYKVHVALHAGDGTDSWGYKRPYVFNTYLREISRLREHNIKYLEIAGNHNLPKQAGSGCYLESLGRYPEIYTVYKGFYEPIEFEEHGAVFHCVPSPFIQEMLDESLQAVTRIDGKINIGVGHFGVTTIKHYAENADVSYVVNLDQLIECKMDYFALGDYHKPLNLGNNIRYSGSIDHLGIDEADNECMTILVAINKETNEVFTKDIPLNVRPMIDLPPIHVEEIVESERTPEEINRLIMERITSRDLTDAIVRLQVTKLPKHYKSAIDKNKIAEITKDALYFKLDLKDKTEHTKTTRTSIQTQFEGILPGWNSFMDEVVDDGTFDKKVIHKKGYDRLATALEQKADKSA